MYLVNCHRNPIAAGLGMLAGWPWRDSWWVGLRAKSMDDCNAPPCGGRSSMSWRPPVYDWQKEYYAWAEARPTQPAQMLTPAQWRRRYARPKMADLLAVTFEILDRPEIWDRHVEFTKRKNSDNPNYRNVDGEPCSIVEDVEFRYMSRLVHDYYNWFRMRKDLDDDPHPYSSIPSVIQRIAEGKIERTDIEGVKNGLRNQFDLSEIDETSNFGSKS